MTVGLLDAPDGSQHLGYLEPVDENNPGYGELSDADFQYGGATHTVWSVDLIPDVLFSISVSPPLPDDASLTLMVDGVPFAIEDGRATTRAGRGTGRCRSGSRRSPGLRPRER